MLRNRVKNLPLAEGSWVENLLFGLDDNLGAPVDLFMENFLLLNAMLSVVSSFSNVMLFCLIQSRLSDLLQSCKQ